MFENDPVEKVRLQFLEDWMHYQWLQWVRGSEVKKCIYEEMDGTTNIGSCPESDEWIINMIGDTMIYEPKPIDFEEFFNEWIEEQGK